MPETEKSKWEAFFLRAILRESEAKLKNKIFNPPSIFVWR